MHRPATLSFVALALAFLAPVSVQAAAAADAIQVGRDYSRVTPAQPTEVAPGEVEVLEFFWYGCPHCFEAEEPVDAWLQAKPGNVVFTRVPATLNRGWVLMAQAYYTAEALGVLDVMHPALFAAFHENPVMLGSPEQVANYFREKAGVENEAFAAAFNSPAVSSNVQRADLLARRYRVRGVPTMVVNGKFSTDPRQAGGYTDMVNVVDTLARLELQDQVPPEPAAETAAPSE